MLARSKVKNINKMTSFECGCVLFIMCVNDWGHTVFEYSHSSAHGLISVCPSLHYKNRVKVDVTRCHNDSEERRVAPTNATFVVQVSVCNSRTAVGRLRSKMIFFMKLGATGIKARLGAYQSAAHLILVEPNLVSHPLVVAHNMQNSGNLKLIRVGDI